MSKQPKPAELTEAQQDVLDFIASAIDEWGYPPTVHEICRHFGWTSPNAAYGHLRS